MTGFGNPKMKVGTGITAGGAFSPQQTQSAQNFYQGMAGHPLNTSNVFGVPTSPAQQQELGSRYASQSRAMAAPVAAQFGRDVSKANAVQTLASERARANSGLQWGQLGNQIRGIDLSNQLANNRRDIQGQMADQNRAFSLFDMILNGIPGLLQ